MAAHRAPDDTFEMNILLAIEDIDPREVIERIPIVLVKGSKHELYITTSRRDVDDMTTTGRIIHKKLRARTAQCLMNEARCRKQGIFAGTVEMSQPSKVIDAINGPIRVQMQATEPAPLKDLERAFAQPSLGASWSPYAIALDEEDALPASMTALIIKWRPTRKKTKRVLKTTATWLVRIAVAVAIGSTHKTIFGDDHLGNDPT